MKVTKNKSDAFDKIAAGEVESFYSIVEGNVVEFEMNFGSYGQGRSLKATSVDGKYTIEFTKEDESNLFLNRFAAVVSLVSQTQSQTQQEGEPSPEKEKKADEVAEEIADALTSMMRAFSDIFQTK
jgi:hypothetical protein